MSKRVRSIVIFVIFGVLSCGVARGESGVTGFISATIDYSLPEKAHVKLDIYNILGQKVETLVDEQKEPGYHSVTWDASDVASGIYFYKLQAGEFTQTKRMTLLK